MGWVTSEFGTRESTSSIVSTYHKGIDIGANKGTDIVASINGKVIISKSSKTYGNYIMIENRRDKNSICTL
ncbi:MAG: M23 family metallopeptidase [Clostridia bacterium]|nr:M23 family metallopeptidase [Clostridia bacterium]